MNSSVFSPPNKCNGKENPCWVKIDKMFSTTARDAIVFFSTKLSMIISENRKKKSLEKGMISVNKENVFFSAKPSAHQAIKSATNPLSCPNET